MHPSELQAMSLEELRRLAAEHHVPGALSLSREALASRLAAVLSHHGGGRAEANARATVPDAVPAAVADRARAGGFVPSTATPERSFQDSPEVIARVYLEQGHPDRAAALFRELLALHPDDATLLAKVAEAESELRRARGVPTSTSQIKITEAPPPATVGEPMGMLDFEELPEAYGIDECEIIAKDPFTLFVYWELTDAGLQAARDHLGDEGADALLVLRLVSTTPPHERGPDRESRDYPLEGHRGRRYLAAPRPGVRLRAAIGLVASSGLFHPIAQSSQVRVPPAEPAAHVATEWMEVVPGRHAGREWEPITIAHKALEHTERGFSTVTGLHSPLPPGPSGAATGGSARPGGSSGQIGQATASSPSGQPASGAGGSLGGGSGKGHLGSGGLP